MLNSVLVFAKLNRMPFILLLVFVALTGSPRYLSAQSNVSYEFWPENDHWYKVSPGIRLSSLVSISRYLESDTRDLNLTLQADYAFGKSKKFLFTRLMDQNQAETLKLWMVRGGYMGGWSLYDKAESYSETMLFPFHLVD